ncbi:GAF domain-containing protein [Nitrosospira sp. Nsp5]|uniref:GAF domain-containing protein n=1 Tax=Nitrosospira multiformis TaxID=1231 RepID=A0ABY0TF35_9PROT|nr:MULTISPECIES: GAF domain-containing protein [Nitrosospira]PTR09169.1 GAF domain-containing protein [Nitrosospira sp. Nsp5]SDQ72507.1 GAF domain-containing protein [Nitrosospira multiformis]
MDIIGNIENQLIKLQDISCFLEEGNFDDNLLQLAEKTAKILGASNCSIMLLNDGESQNPRMRVCASYGPLPAAAYKESVRKGEGIAGHVVATGKSLFIEDINKSEFANRARRTNDPHKSLLCSPIRINTCIAGVVNVTGCDNEASFKPGDLNLLDVIALFIGKSIQTIQLQSILNSRFAQLALIQETQKNMNNSLGSTLHNPDQIAKIMAKSFYKEMTRLGFGSGQVINVASDIIDQLNANLQRHSKRMKRGQKESPDETT